MAFFKFRKGSDDQTATPQNLIVVQNWSEELKRLVPKK